MERPASCGPGKLRSRRRRGLVEHQPGGRLEEEAKRSGSASPDTLVV
jgi:hypothetical protein